MDIGEEKETFIIEPIEVPVPGHSEPAPPEPNYEPAPKEVEVAEPELVPA